MDHLLDRQSGVVARQQLLDAGLAPHDVRRLLRRRDLVVLHPGVYLDHTGVPTWTQRAWAAVLHRWPAALCHESALAALESGARGGTSTTIHVAVARDRVVDSTPGVRVHRVADLDGRVLWRARPPRYRVEEALVDVASSAPDEVAAIAVLADAVQARRTSPARLAAALEGRGRVPRRAFLAGVLTDVANGTGSVLEHRYLTGVERAHGLPVADRQVRDGRHVRDAVYVQQGLVVELDGRAFHDGAVRREADLGRDLEAAVHGLVTVRLGWAQVVGDPCRTARWVAQLLRARGWQGRPHPCRDRLCGAGVSPGGT